MLLSIIIPVYNVEKYIRKTLSSIYDQCFDESVFETIVVNDGTPDLSMSIVDEFARTHSNLKIINQENQGLSGARNSGLTVACGNFIWFVDSDDCVSHDSLSVLQRILAQKEADVYAFDMIKIFEESEKEFIERQLVKKRYYRFYNHAVVGTSLFRKIQTCPTQRFVFKKSFLNDLCLKFYPKILHEDEDFCVQAINNADKMICIDSPIYRYLIRTSGSIMSGFKMKSVTSRNTVCENFIEYAKKTASATKKAAYHDRIFENTVSLLTIKQKNNQEYNLFLKENRLKLKKRACLSFAMSLKYMGFGKLYKFLKILFV